MRKPLEARLQTSRKDALLRSACATLTSEHLIEETKCYVYCGITMQRLVRYSNLAGQGKSLDQHSEGLIKHTNASRWEIGDALYSGVRFNCNSCVCYCRVWWWRRWWIN